MLGAMGCFSIHVHTPFQITLSNYVDQHIAMLLQRQLQYDYICACIWMSSRIFSRNKLVWLLLLHILLLRSLLGIALKKSGNYSLRNTSEASLTPQKVRLYNNEEKQTLFVYENKFPDGSRSPHCAKLKQLLAFIVITLQFPSAVTL